MKPTEKFIHPSQMTDAQRRENTAALHDRFARAFTKVGDQRNADVARKAAKRTRES